MSPNTTINRVNIYKYLCDCILTGVCRARFSLDLLVAVSLPLFLGVAREFLSPSTLGPLGPTELLLLATLAPATGIRDTEEDLLEEEAPEAVGIPLDLPGLVWPAGTWSWLLLIL